MRIGHHHGPRRPLLATTDRARRPGGYVLVEFAFLLVPLLLMVGLSVDVGYWYSRASNLQKAADSAALAGVVWLPDTSKARTAALEAAARNGFVNGVDGIQVTVDPVGERRLRVTIVDPTVDSFFYQVLGGRTIELSRTGTAEYVLPVPLGSPRNHFGTGSLLASDPELIYQAINTACTSKVNGDRHQSLHYSPLSTNGSNLSSCSAVSSNAEYRTRGYELYVEAPVGRTANIDVLLYDPRYNDGEVPTGQHQQVCGIWGSANWNVRFGGNNLTVHGPALYQRRSTLGGAWGSNEYLASGESITVNWQLIRFQPKVSASGYATNWNAITSGSSYRIYGPARYQTRSSVNGTWSGNQTVAAGASVTHNWDLIRHQPGTQACWQEPIMEAPVDMRLRNPFASESFTFSLISENGTPLDDSDNFPVPGCTKTYSELTPFDLTYLGSVRWNRLCTITTGMPAGRYIVRVTNGAPGSLAADGSNQWGLVAKYTNATANNGLCDGRTNAMCPRVYGRDAISVYANTTDGVASFFLAEIPEYHVGKTLELELWDPGEGGSKIEILQPTGANTWGLKTFSWASFNDNGSSHQSGNNVTSVSVTNNVFNGRLLRIRIQLDGYNPPANNKWWKIQYTFGSGVVTDRTTWSARVIGDPVHLVEEDL